MVERALEIEEFLNNSGWGRVAMSPLAGDASSRRYYRVIGAEGSAILMDHPPDHGSVQPFLHIAEHLQGCGFSAPSVFAADIPRGLILMEDLGNAIYTSWLESRPQDEEVLYGAAVDLLFHLHQVQPPAGLKDYNPAMMAKFIDPAFDHYLCDVAPSDQILAIFAELETVLTHLAPETDCMILRDFHADNLLWLPERAAIARVGLLDFQDALIGHRCYDLVSLLQDARRDVSPMCRHSMIGRYAALSGRPPAEVEAACSAQGAQRNLRILGIFARLSAQDGKHGYIELIPRVWGHLMDNLNHPALCALRQMVLSLFPVPDASHLERLRSK